MTFSKEQIKELMLTQSLWRKSIKDFQADKPISDEDFNYLLEVARLSPSSMGFEPWKILVIDNKELREKLVPVSLGAKRQLPSCAKYVIFLADNNASWSNSEYWGSIERRGLNKEQSQAVLDHFKYFQEDCLDLHSQRELLDWAAKQAYIALGNMLTAAALIGIDSCPIEGYDPKATEQFLADYNQDNKLYDSSRYKPVVAAAFGYRAHEGYPKHRKDPKDLFITVK